MSRDTDRRQFIKTGLIAGAAIVTCGPTIFAPGGAQAQTSPDTGKMEFPDIVICKGRSPEAMTRGAVDALGGMKRFVKPGAKVVIKPNMSFASGPDAASNTHPGVVAELAKMCSEAGASRISILDNALNQPEDCLRLSKIPDACQGVSNTTANILKAKRMFREVKVEKGKLIKTMDVMAEVLDADVLIAAPVGKSHSSSGVSLSMKGMMGLVFDRNVFHRNDLHESIVDMVTVIKPNLVVVDGTRILSSGGPGGPGKVIPMNLVIASTDMVAADAQMVALGTWYGKKLQPDQVRHIKLAAERGLGRLDLSALNTKNIEV
jgi:uncharacterized protein (DUF362 family)